MKIYFWTGLIFLSVAFFSFYPVTDTDIWWHLSAAREMLAHKTFLREDPFSYTPSFSPWLNLHWLYQLLVYATYSLAWIFGLIALKAIFFGSAYVLNYISSLKSKHNMLRFTIFVLFSYKVRYLMLDRPVMITLLCIALFLFILERFRETGNLKLLLFLLPIQIIWVNCQGLSAIGLFIFGCYFIETLLNKRSVMGRFSIIMVALLLCGLINPYGLDGVFLPIRLFSRILPGENNLYSMNVSENMPLRFLPSSDMHFAYTSLVMAILILYSIYLNRHKVRISHIILVCGFGLLCTMALRNVLLFVFIGLFIVNYNLSNMPDVGIRSRLRISGIFVGTILILFVFFLHLNILFKCRNLHGLSPFRVPDKAIEYLEEYPIKGNCFNGDRYGGYLLWRMYPRKKVFIDGRFTIRPSSVFREYLDALDRPETFPMLVEKYAITLVMLPIASFDRFLPLACALYKNDLWELLYIDGSTVLFAKKGMGGTPALRLDNIPVVEGIVQDIKHRWDGNASVQSEALAYFNNYVNCCR